MKKKIVVGIIGLGVGKRHLDAYLKYGCKVKKIYDFKIETLKNIKKEHPRIEICKNENEIFDDPEINLVSIASYDNFHYNQLIKSIKSKKNIFVEKPIVQKEEHAKKIINLLNKHKNIFIQTNFILTESPRFISLKQDIKKKKYGEIYKIDAEYNYGRIEKLTKGWRGKIPFYSVTQGGGIHMIDLISWLIDSKVREVKSYSNKICTKSSRFKFDDCVVSLLKYENGAIVNLTSNFGCVYPHFHKLSVYGTKKTFENNVDKIHIFEKRDKKKYKRIPNNYKKYYKGKTLKSFIDLLKKNGNREKIIQRIFNSINVCFAIEKSIKNNKSVKIKY